MKEQKNAEWLQDVIGELDDTFLIETEQMRNQRILDESDKRNNSSKLNHFETKEYQKEINKQLVQQTEKKNLKYSWKKLGTMVACVCVFFIGVFTWKSGLFSYHSSDSSQNTNSVIEQTDEEIYQNTNTDEAERHINTVISDLTKENIQNDTNSNKRTDSVETIEIVNDLPNPSSSKEGENEQKSEAESVKVSQGQVTKKQSINKVDSGVSISKKEELFGDRQISR